MQACTYMHVHECVRAVCVFVTQLARQQDIIKREIQTVLKVGN